MQEANMNFNPRTRRLSELSPDPEPLPELHTYALNDHANNTANNSSTPTKRQKPQSGSASTTECWDWIVSTGNVHYACSTTAFVEYTPLTETWRLRHNYSHGDDDGGEGEDELEVVGMGKVVLAVQNQSQDAGADAGADSAVQSHTITLDNVLHIPTAICNGFSPLVYGGGMSCQQDVWVGGSGDGKWVARPFAGGMRLVLSGGRKGGSEVVDGVGGIGYSFRVCVSPVEWEGIVGSCLQGGVDGYVDGMME